MGTKCVNPEFWKFQLQIYMSLSQQVNILWMQTTHYFFCAFSILSRISGKYVSLTVEMAIVVFAVVDVANIVAIASVTMCALWTLSIPQIQCPFVKTLNLCSFNTILDKIDKRLSTTMKQKLRWAYFSFVKKYDDCDQNVNINISDS